MPASGGEKAKKEKEMAEATGMQSQSLEMSADSLNDNEMSLDKLNMSMSVEETSETVLDSKMNAKSVSNGNESSLQQRYFSLHSTMSSGLSKFKGFAARARPWTEFVEISEYSLPKSSDQMPMNASSPSDMKSTPATLDASTALNRSMKNFKLYSINYAFVVALVTSLYVVFNPYSFLILGMVMSMWIYVYILRDENERGTIVLCGRTLSSWETTLAMGISSVVIIFFMSNTGHVLLGKSALTVS